MRFGSQTRLMALGQLQGGTPWLHRLLQAWADDDVLVKSGRCVFLVKPG
jgi:hypothetical protein